jgi:hypothetical protein
LKDLGIDRSIILKRILKIGVDGVGFIHLARDWAQWGGGRVLVKMIIDLWFHKGQGISWPAT